VLAARSHSFQRTSAALPPEGGIRHRASRPEPLADPAEQQPHPFNLLHAPGSIVPTVRISFAPPVHPFGTFFSLHSPSAGMAQNAVLLGHLSEPGVPARKPTLGGFRLSPAPFSNATEPRSFWYGCHKGPISTS
jgi:hypothetical protein